MSEDPTLPRRITSWFDRKRFRVEMSSPRQLDASRILTPKHPGTLYVWATLGKDNVAHLYFATTNPSRQRVVYLTRDLQLNNGLDEIGAERVAQVLHMSALAILEGQEETELADIERKLRAEGANKTSQAPADTNFAGISAQQASGGGRGATQRVFEVGIGYGMSFHADEGIWHGPRGLFELFLTQALAVGGMIRTGVPHSQDVEGITLSVEAMSVEAFASWHTQLTSRLSAVVYAGPGFDLVYHRPTLARDPDTTLAQGAAEARPNLIAGVGAIVGESFPRVAITLDAAALLSGTQYELIDGRSRRARAHAAEFAPGLGLELRF